MSDTTLREALIAHERVIVHMMLALGNVNDTNYRSKDAIKSRDAFLAALADSADADEAATGRLLALKKNWDSYGGQAIRRKAVDAAIRIRAAVATEPSFVPMSNGGVQVEWHRQGFDIELEVSPDGTLQCDSADAPEGPYKTLKEAAQGVVEVVDLHGLRQLVNVERLRDALDRLDAQKKK